MTVDTLRVLLRHCDPLAQGTWISRNGSFQTVQASFPRMATMYMAMVQRHGEDVQGS